MSKFIRNQLESSKQCGQSSHGRYDIIMTHCYCASGHIHIKIHVLIAYELCFGCSTYAQKAKEITFLLETCCIIGTWVRDHLLCEA
jgi:hypothetical protein